MSEKWLNWARTLQAQTQNGLAYCKNPFDIERYQLLHAMAMEMLAEVSGQEPARVTDIFANEVGYTTPKVDVRAAAFRDHKVLLVREMLDSGRWTLPGGWMDAGDSPGGAAVREFREETGYEVRLLKLAAVYDRARHGHPNYFFSTVKLFFVCELTGGQPQTSVETGESDFFDVDALPELSVARVTMAEIRMLYKHFCQPKLPTEYDL